MASLLHPFQFSYFLHIPTLSLLAFVAGVLFLSLWYTKSSHAKLHKLPPGPKALPFLGHLHLLGSDLPHRAFTKLSKIHGPLMYLRLGSVDTVVASSPEMARQILQTHDQTFASRPRTAAAIHMFFDCSDIALAPHGPYWKLMRKLCITDLFHGKRIEAFRGVREEEVGKLLKNVLKEGRGSELVPSMASMERDGAMCIRDKLKMSTSDIICRMTLSKRLSGRSDILEVMEDFLELIGAPNLGDLFPCLAWMDIVQGRVRRMKAVRHRIRETFRKVIEARRAERFEREAACASKDLLDDLLALSESNDNEFDVTVTDENITAVLLDMFAAGTDTSSFTVEWGLAELIANPTIMKKAQDELDLVVGKERLLKEADISHLPYLQAIVKETMRFHPPGPLLAPHESVQPCYINGYYIPAKSTAFVNIYAIGRDPSVWENPLVFLPERFMGSKIDGQGQHFLYLPFGSGKRSCPGWQLGLLNTQLMLGSLIHFFDWSLPTSTEGKVDLTEKFTLSLTLAHPLTLKACPRTPIHLLNDV